MNYVNFYNIPADNWIIKIIDNLIIKINNLCLAYIYLYISEFSDYYAIDFFFQYVNLFFWCIIFIIAFYLVWFIFFVVVLLHYQISDYFFLSFNLKSKKELLIVFFIVIFLYCFFNILYYYIDIDIFVNIFFKVKQIFVDNAFKVKHVFADDNIDRNLVKENIVSKELESNNNSINNTTIWQNLGMFVVNGTILTVIQCCKQGSFEITQATAGAILYSTLQITSLMWSVTNTTDLVLPLILYFNFYPLFDADPGNTAANLGAFFPGSSGPVAGCILPEAVQEAVQEVVQLATQEVVQESISQAVQVASQAVQESIAQVVVQVASQEVAQVAVQEVAQVAVQEVAQVAVQEVAQVVVQEVAQVVVQDEYIGTKAQRLAMFTICLGCTEVTLKKLVHELFANIPLSITPESMTTASMQALAKKLDYYNIFELYYRKLSASYMLKTFDSKSLIEQYPGVNIDLKNISTTWNLYTANPSTFYDETSKFCFIRENLKTKSDDFGLCNLSHSAKYDILNVWDILLTKLGKPFRYNMTSLSSVLQSLNLERVSIDINNIPQVQGGNTRLGNTKITFGKDIVLSYEMIANMLHIDVNNFKQLNDITFNQIFALFNIIYFRAINYLAHLQFYFVNLHIINSENFDTIVALKHITLIQALLSSNTHAMLSFIDGFPIKSGVFRELWGILSLYNLVESTILARNRITVFHIDINQIKMMLSELSHDPNNNDSN